MARSKLFHSLVVMGAALAGTATAGGVAVGCSSNGSSSDAGACDPCVDSPCDTLAGCYGNIMANLDAFSPDGRGDEYHSIAPPYDAAPDDVVSDGGKDAPSDGHRDAPGDGGDSG